MILVAEMPDNMITAFMVYAWEDMRKVKTRSVLIVQPARVESAFRVRSGRVDLPPCVLSCALKPA